MPNRARFFIGLTILSGFLLVTRSLWTGLHFAQPGAFLAYCALVLVSSTLKVRLPGLSGTISLNFLFILMAIAVFTCAETEIFGCVGGLIQCLWRAKRRPTPIQVLFNAAALAISSALSYRVAHLSDSFRPHQTAVLLAVAASIYFATNTFLASGVMSLVEGKRMLATWRQCYLWSFPYYLVGATIAGLVVSLYEAGNWLAPLTILPSMYLVYLFYRMFTQRLSEFIPAHDGGNSRA